MIWNLKELQLLENDYRLTCPELFENNIWFQKNSYGRFVPNKELFVLRFNTNLYKMQYILIYHNQIVIACYLILNGKIGTSESIINLSYFSDSDYISDNLTELTKRYENLTLLG